MGPGDKLGSESGYTLVAMVVLAFIMPFILIAVLDYNEINNAKDSVDKETKRAITTCMVIQVEDSMSSNRKISIDQRKLEEEIKKTAEKNIYEKYKFDFEIDNVTVTFNEKYYVTYEGYITYAPMIFKGKEEFTIPVTGRSKIQRFDKE